MKGISIVVITNSSENQLWYQYLPIEGKKIETLNFDNSLELLKNSHADLILLDCEYETNRGLQLLRGIKKIRRELPVIFITANGSKELVLEVFRSQAREYFEKPINIFELSELIKTLVKIKNTSKESRFTFSFGFKKMNLSIADITTNMPINILRAVYYIEKNLHGDIKLDNIAKVACVSKYHFCRSFNKYIAISPMKFVVFRRIERAKILLKTNNLSMLSVANLVGFKDYGRFIRHFKKLTGVTPLEYKKHILDN